MRAAAISLIAFAAAFPAVAGETDVVSRIDAVTIYPDAAIVTRLAEVDAPAGDSVLTFRNLPLGLDPGFAARRGRGRRGADHRLGRDACRAGRSSDGRRRADDKNRRLAPAARRDPDDDRRAARQARDDRALLAERAGEAVARFQAARRRRLVGRVGRGRNGARQGQRRSHAGARKGARPRRADRRPRSAAAGAAAAGGGARRHRRRQRRRRRARIAVAFLPRRRRRLDAALRRGAEDRRRGRAEHDADPPRRHRAIDRRGLERRRADRVDGAGRARRRRRRSAGTAHRLLAAGGRRNRPSARPAAKRAAAPADKPALAEAPPAPPTYALDGSAPAADRGPGRRGAIAGQRLHRRVQGGGPRHAGERRLAEVVRARPRRRPADA